MGGGDDVALGGSTKLGSLLYYWGHSRVPARTGYHMEWLKSFPVVPQ